MTPDKDIITAEVVEVPKPERHRMHFGLKMNRDGCWRMGQYAFIDAGAATRWQGEQGVTDRERIIVVVPGSTPQPQPAAPETDAVAEKHRLAKLEIAVRAMRMILVDAAQYEEHQIIKSPWLGQMQLAIKKTEGLV